MLHAIDEDMYKFANLLIKCGADVDCKDVYGEHILGKCVYSGDLTAVVFLLENGANPYLPSASSDGGLLGDACYQGHYEIVKYLVEQVLLCTRGEPLYRSRMYLLHYACCLTVYNPDRIELTRYLTRIGFSVHEKSKSGNTPLNIAKATLGKNRSVGPAGGNSHDQYLEIKDLLLQLGSKGDFQ